MIEDSIIVVLVCFMPVQQPNEVKENRFEEAFEQADKEFDKTHKFDIEALKRAAHEASISAAKKTKAERDEVMKPIFDVNDLFRKEE